MFSDEVWTGDVKYPSADPSKTLRLSTKPLEITAAGPSETPLAALGGLKLRKHCTCRQI